MSSILILLLASAWAGQHVENTTLNVFISGGEPVNLRVHIRAVAGLTAPASADYRVQYQSGQNASQVYNQTGHDALKSASGGASACNPGGSFTIQATSTLGSFWASLNLSLIHISEPTRPY